jgi:hypothetical protein
MLLLVKLLLAHLLGDFIFQPNSWIQKKEIKKHKAWQLYAHVIIHGLLIILLVQNFNFWLPALIIVISHWLVDTLKLVFQKDTTKRSWFMVDQVLHLSIILIVWYSVETPSFSLDIINSPNSLLLLTVIIFITNPASIIIKTFISQWTPDLWTNNSNPAPTTNPTSLSTVSNPSPTQITSPINAASLLNAGKFIGILERLFVFAFVLTNNWDAIGFLIAAKSVFRFGDLKESKDLKLTEYVLIGTLLSFGIAIAAGLVIRNFGSINH